MLEQFHSQWGQDRFVVDALKGKRNGYYVDIGAFDGVTISNTLYLEQQLGWTGLNVEANPHTFKSLVAARKTPCVNLAIAPYEKEVDILLNGWSSAINDSFTSSEILKQNHQSVKVRAITVNALLKQYSVPSRFDYLSLDIEGGELEILEQFDFGQWRFSVLTYEHNAHLTSHPDHKLMLERQSRAESLLFRNGYKLVKNYEGDGFFISNDIS